MRPSFRIPQLAGDPLSLTLIDELDFASDRANIQLYLGPQVRSQSLPAAGTVIDIEAGYQPDWLHAGQYVVEGVQLDHQYRLSVQAASLNFTAAMKQPRHATYENESLASIFQSLGSRHGLAVETCTALSGVVPEHLTQANQSDLDFMYRTAANAGVRMNALIDRLVFTDFDSLNQGERRLQLGDCLSFQLMSQAKPQFASVRAHYWDPKQPGITKLVAYPHSKEPYYDLPGYYESEAKAKSACEGQHRQRQTQVFSVNAALSGDLSWHAGLALAFEHPDIAEASNRYYIRRVQHRFSAQGFQTHLEAC